MDSMTCFNNACFLIKYTSIYLPDALMYGTWILFEKFHW